MNKKTQKIGVICSIVQIILSIICLIYSAINQENIIMWVLFLCSGILSLSSNISRNNKKKTSEEVQIPVCQAEHKNRTPKNWPLTRAVCVQSAVFFIPKIKKVYRNDKRESHFLRPVILCIDLRETFWENRTIVAAQRKWAVCHTSEFSFPSLLSALFETATTVCCNSSLTSV